MPVRLPGAALLLALGSFAAHAATYDAIAIDDAIPPARGNGDYAVGQAATATEAQRIAMSNCTLGGNIACAIKLTYLHCGAYAASPDRAGTGLGDTLQQASIAALSSCGDADCKLAVADCVDVPLRPPR